MPRKGTEEQIVFVHYIIMKGNFSYTEKDMCFGTAVKGKVGFIVAFRAALNNRLANLAAK
jgi:hypothetical protein